MGDAIAGVFGGVAGVLSLEPPNREKRLRFFVDSSSFFSSTTTGIAQKKEKYINVVVHSLLVVPFCLAIKNGKVLEQILNDVKIGLPQVSFLLKKISYPNDVTSYF